MAGNLTAMIAAAFSGGAAPPVTSDPYFEYTTLLLPGNGTNGAQNNTFLDGSTNNFTITRNGNTTQGTFSPFSQTGWGNYFNGSSYLIDSSLTASITGDFTLEFWWYPMDLSAGYNLLYGNNASGSGANYFGLSGTTWVFNNGSETSLGSFSYSANNWYHIALVRSSGSIKVYVNGTGGSSYSNSATWAFGSGTTIGSFGSGFIAKTCYLSNVRLVNGTAVYTSNFTPSTAPLTAISGTSLLTCQSNRFIDNSTNNFTITRNGDTRVVAFSPFNPSASWSAATYGGSGYFDGSGDSLGLPTNASFAMETGDFTIEFWLYTSNVAQGGYIIQTDTVSAANSLYISFQSSALKLTNAASVFASTPTLSNNTWVHIAVVRTGTSVVFYTNGVAGSSATCAVNFTQGSAGIGLQNFIGYLSNLRIVKGTAVYTGNFTPPTAPLTAITNTSLLLNFTNAGIYDATSKNDLETVGNAQISTTQSKWGGSSMYFDGTGDYLITNVSTADLYSFGTGDWTVEFWVRFNNTTGDGCIFDTRNATDTLNVSILRSTTTIIFQTGGATRITSGTITSNVWYHVALARSGTSTKMFIDGTQAGSTYTDTTSYTAGANRPIVGAVSLSGFVGISALNGYVNDLRVTKGYARYTANFTAPTAAFPTL